MELISEEFKNLEEFNILIFTYSHFGIEQDAVFCVTLTWGLLEGGLFIGGRVFYWREVCIQAPEEGWVC